MLRAILHFLNRPNLTFQYSLCESRQNKARAAMAKNAGRKSRPQRGIENVLWQTAGWQQVDLEIPENRPHERGHGTQRWGRLVYCHRRRII